MPLPLEQTRGSKWCRSIFWSRPASRSARARPRSARPRQLTIKDPVIARVFVERVAELCDKGVVMGLAPAALSKTLLRHHASRGLGQHLAALSDWMTTPVRHDDTRANLLIEAVGLERPDLASILPSMIEHVRARVRAGRFEAPDAEEAASVVA